MKNILIVCTGNICRSPLIAGILENAIIRSGWQERYTVSSAGTFATSGLRAHEYSILAGESLGVDLSAHRARILTQGMIDSSALIICAEKEHKDYILRNFSQATDKCFTFGECIGIERDIPGPYGDPIEPYLKLANWVTKQLPRLFDFIQHFLTNISIGCDHNGFKLATKITKYLKIYKTIAHFPVHLNEPVDYPDPAWAVAEDIYQKRADIGVLICKSGIGMSIVANKHIGIRAALCDTPELARIARAHNDANILCLGTMSVSDETAYQMITEFLSTGFEHGRHTRRLEKLSNFEKSRYNRD